MRPIAVANQKGGVGKTTTSVNLAVGLARAGRPVCLIDFDPQAHATLHVGVTPGSHPVSGYDLLTADVSLAEATVQAAENLVVVPSHIDLTTGPEGAMRRRGGEVHQKVAAMPAGTASRRM